MSGNTTEEPIEPEVLPPEKPEQDRPRSPGRHADRRRNPFLPRLIMTTGNRLRMVTCGGLLILGCFTLRTYSGQAPQAADCPDGQLRLILGGDTSFGENYQQYIEKHGGENILKTKGYLYSLKNFTSFLDQADLVIANLETPLTDLTSSKLKCKKQYIHWSDPVRAPRTLKQHNIGVVSLANNHTLDYGIAGLHQSLHALRKYGIQWLGAGKDEESAAQPLRFDWLLEGQAFRFVIAAGFEYRQNYDEVFDFYAGGDRGGANAWTKNRATEQIEAIRRADPDALVVAYPHFGKNYEWRTENQRELAQALIDAGADLIIGHGAHMFQEIEQYRGRWIIYSLGNFMFNSPGRYLKKKADPFSLVARLDVTKNQGAPTVALRLYPVISDNRITNYQPCFVSEQQFRRVQELLLRHSTDAESLRRSMGTGEDRFGRYLVFDVAFGKEAFEQ